MKVRNRAGMARKAYDSDVKDDEWRELRPLLPQAKSGGRSRTTEVREVYNAIQYFVKTGFNKTKYLQKPKGRCFTQAGTRVPRASIARSATERLSKRSASS